MDSANGYMFSESSFEGLYPPGLSNNASGALNVVSASSAHKSAPPAGATVSVTATTRMKTYGVANVPQQTRHARRIYVGGVPPNYIDEDGLRDFFNAVLAQGLNEENDHSYVLSVYVDQKKCFSFVELKSIELASACLALDGIVMKNIVLRILRANEYKPELIPHSLTSKNMHLDLSGFQFGVPSASAHPGSDGNDALNDKTLDSLIQYNNLNVLEAGSVIIVGYPYDETHKKSSSRSGSTAISASSSSAQVPKMLRNAVRKGKFGCVENAEYDVDLSALKVLDIGDVIAGKSVEETRVNLVTTVSELVVRAGIPVVVGGSNELIYSSVSGLMTVCGGDVSALCVSARLNTRLLDDSRFCRLASASAPFPSCDERFVLFGAQGSQLCRDEAKYIENRNGRIVYLSKDIRANPAKSVTAHFEDSLHALCALQCKETRVSREPLSSSELDGEAAAAASPAPPVVVCFDAGALHSSLSPQSSSGGALGFYFEEVMEMARLAGKCPQVAMLTITEFSSPSLSPSEDSRLHMLVAELLYHFLLGVAQRSPSLSHSLCGERERERERDEFLRGPFNCATTLVGDAEHVSPSQSLSQSLSQSQSNFAIDRSLSHSLSAQSLSPHPHNNNGNGSAQRERERERLRSAYPQMSVSQRSLTSPAHSTHNLLSQPHTQHTQHGLSHHTHSNASLNALSHSASHHSLVSRSSSFYGVMPAHNATTQFPSPQVSPVPPHTHSLSHTQTLTQTQPPSLQQSLYRGLSSHNSSFYSNNGSGAAGRAERDRDRDKESVHAFDEALDLCGASLDTAPHNAVSQGAYSSGGNGYSVVSPHNAYTQASAADFGLRPEYR